MVERDWIDRLGKSAAQVDARVVGGQRAGDDARVIFAAAVDHHPTSGASRW